MDLYAQGNESISYLTAFRVFITDSWFNPGFSFASFHFIRVALCPKKPVNGLQMFKAIYFIMTRNLHKCKESALISIPSNGNAT